MFDSRLGLILRFDFNFFLMQQGPETYTCKRAIPQHCIMRRRQPMSLFILEQMILNMESGTAKRAS